MMPTVEHLIRRFNGVMSKRAIQDYVINRLIEILRILELSGIHYRATFIDPIYRDVPLEPDTESHKWGKYVF
jgi:hypothetical protein